MATALETLSLPTIKRRDPQEFYDEPDKDKGACEPSEKFKWESEMKNLDKKEHNAKKSSSFVCG